MHHKRCTHYLRKNLEAHGQVQEEARTIGVGAGQGFDTLTVEKSVIGEAELERIEWNVGEFRFSEWGVKNRH